MALLNTDLLSAHDQTFRQDRYMHESWLQEGVVGAGDMKVTPGGASLQWSVAAGVAWVKGDDTTRQGLYHQINDAAVTGTVAAGHATLPRVDALVLQMADSSVAGVSDTPTYVIRQGTPTSGAQITNSAGANYRAGAASIGNSAFHICDFAIPAAHSGVLTTAMIVDRRKWARGAFNRIERTTGTYTVASTTLAELDTTNLKPRIECSGLPVRLTFNFLATTTGGAQPRVWFAQDGTALNSMATAGALSAITVPGSAGDFFFTVSRMVVPTAGSHTFAPMVAMMSGATNVIVRAAATQPVEFIVEELLRQNASND